MDAKADDATDTVTITLHDLYIDRKEALPDKTKLDDCLKASEHARKIQVPKGTTLEKALTGNNNVTLGTKSLAATGVYKTEVTPDKYAMTSVADASDCVWYTRADSEDGNGNGGVDGNNPRTKLDKSTAIDKDIHLYTYSYRLRLITAKDTYKDLIVREGQSKGIAYGSDTNTANTDISSFLSNANVASWTDVNEGKLLETDVLSNGLTRNYTLRANGVDAPTKEIPCYVAVNGKWTQIYTIQMDTDRVDVWGRTGPELNYYVTDAELKTAYSAYGFGTDVTFEGGITSKDKNGYFPFAYGDNKQLQNRQMPKQAEGSTQFRVPLVEDTKDITKNLAIYYTPHSTTGYVTTDNSDVLKNNSFYTISVDEADKSKFSDTVTLPDTKILSGGDTTFELPSKDKDGNAVTWYTEKGGDVTTISKKDENTVTVTVKGINEQVLLTTDKSKAEGLKVHCFVLIDQQPVEVGLLTTTKTQSDTSWGTGKNYKRYYITSAQAETVYKKYGFDASQYAPNTTAAQKYNFAIGFYDKDLTISDNSARMWADIVPIEAGGEYKIPMISEEDGKKHGSCSVYYIPNNTGKKDFWTKDITIDKNSFTTSTDFLKSNSFYTVSAQDDAGKFGSDTAMPEKQCILNGKSVTMTLPYKEGVKWYANGIQVEPENINGDKADYTVTVNQKTTFTTKVSLMPINAYVVIDDKWTPVEKEWTWDSSANKFKGGKLTISEDQTTGTGNNERYYITETQLKQIFEAYDPSIKVENTNHFAHEMIVKSNPDTVWADTTVFTVGSEKCIPLNMLTSGKGAAIYYTPKDSGKLSNTDALRKKNCLKYSISANNKKDYAYVNTSAELPEKAFFDTGATKNVSITLPNFSESAIQWVAKDTNGKDCTNQFTQTVNESDYTTTYTLNQTDGIRQQYIFEPKNANQKLRVVYNTDVSKSLEDIFSKNGQKDYQKVVQPCSIKGDITYTTSEIQKNASYTVLRPDDDYAVVNHTKYSKQYYYTFDCWEVTTVGGGKKTIQAGAVLDYATLQEYANADAEVQLQAKWKLRDKKGRPDSVNFFVGLGCEILDYGGNTKSQPKENFTKDSVYSTRIHGTDHVIGHALMDENNKYQSGIYIADAANANTAFDLDKDLRNAANNIPLYVTSDKTASQSIYCPLDEGVNKAEITVDSMPTDEEIFRKIRNSKEEVYKYDANKTKVIIPKENLTTDKYAIRWYVLKYQNSDGWHIDGVLVEKNAKIIIKKTFVGDSEAIDEVKKNYSITVTKSDDSKDTRTLTLKAASSSDSTDLGYTTYDEATDTYTWVVEGYQGEQYTVKEQNYTAKDITSEETSRAGALKKAFTSTSRYSIHNAENHEHDTNGDKPYTDDGVSVTMAAYAADIDNQYYQTVHLTNIYAQAGILTLSKADRVTGHGLGNVQFKLSNQNGSELKLLRRPNTNQYSVKTQQAGNLGYTETVPDNIVQTDANGYVQLRLPPLIDGDTVDTRYDGEYFLEEILPEGYTGAKKISITVTDQGGVRFTIVALDDNDNDTTSTWLDNTQNDAPILYNTSKMLTTVTAVKKWTATTLDDSKVPVTVQLCRNGRPLENVSDKVYTQTLNAANHWQYTWENLPLYVDGEIAKYSLRELFIGDTKYDANVINDYDTDGYEEYEVTEDATKYYEGEDSPIQSDNTVDESKFKHTLAAWKDNSGKMHYSNHALLVIRNAPVSADISFEKVDAEHGRALANAEFTLYSDEQCTQKVTGEGFQNPEVSNYEFGTVQFNNLPAGTYYFKETKAPPGYEMDDTIYKAVIRNGKTDITPMPKGREEESKQSNGMTVTNVSKMKLTIKKVDMDGNLITSSPATFKIQEGTDSTKIQQTNNGEITLTNVAEGEQYIFEVSAPAGYKTLDTHVTLEIANGEIKSIEDNPDKEHWVLQRDGDCLYTLTVKNEPLVSLPSAGGRGYPLALLLGAGLMCGASGLALWLRRRRNQ
ncbi:MAG: SpaA isopeptide-forming pilin-related protein [Butyricicoccus sp.]|nr:SpaA isopeptide-forming pilin-related protein [Butyricicoccus sp.]